MLLHVLCLLIFFYLLGNSTSTLQYLVVSNTTSGIQINSMNTFIHNVTSTYSASNGFTIYVNSNISKGKMSELNATHNLQTGIEIVTEGYPIAEIIVFEIQNCTVSQNKEYGIDIKANASVVISDCLVEGNTESGIYVYQKFGGRMTIRSSKISRNVKYAIKEYFTEEFVVDSCIISDHNYRRFTRYWFRRISYVYLQRKDNSKFHIKILNNVFENNINDGIAVDLYYPSVGDYMIHIENNTFMNGYKTLVINTNTWYQNMAYVKIFRNLFVNNSNTDGALLQFEFEHVGDVKFENNKFDGNSVGTTLRFTGNVRHSLGTISIQHNIIPGDRATDSLIDITSYHPVTVNNNYLRNLNSDVCVIRAPKFDESFVINATFNYWGKTVAMDIVNIVCGFEKDMDKSVVNYIPFYIDNDFNQLVSEAQDDFDVQGTFGGDISKNFTIPIVAGPIVISRSLFVRYICYNQTAIHHNSIKLVSYFINTCL